MGKHPVRRFFPASSAPTFMSSFENGHHDDKFILKLLHLKNLILVRAKRHR